MWAQIGAVVLLALIVIGAATSGGGDEKSEVATSSSSEADETTTSTTAATTTTEAEEERPGNPAVYERIEAMTDCAELQKEFDTAMDNADRYEPGDEQREWSIAYAEAADGQMEQNGCY